MSKDSNEKSDGKITKINPKPAGNAKGISTVTAAYSKRKKTTENTKGPSKVTGAHSEK